MPVIPAIRNLRQEDHKFEASLPYILRLSQNNKKIIKYKRNNIMTPALNSLELPEAEANGTL